MVEVAETKMCDMCEKPIEMMKYRLHSVACARNNYKCAKCGEIVAKVEREQHEEDVHTDKPDLKCDLCCEFSTKEANQLSQHRLQECKKRPQAQTQAQQPASMAQLGAASSGGGPLQKCLYCPMEIAAGPQLDSHVAYCGSKTKECPECFSSVQSWMMTQHKESGQCANLVLDRAETNEQDQLKQVMERSAFDTNGVAASGNDLVGASQVMSAAAVPSQSHQFMGGAAGQSTGAADIDENEKEIARILQEEANALDGGSAAAQQQPFENIQGNDPYSQQMESGVRAPDQARMQCLAGPDSHYDEDGYDQELAMAQGRQNLQQHDINSAINQRIAGDVGSGISGMMSYMSQGIGSLFGGGATEVAHAQAQPQPQPLAGDTQNPSNSNNNFGGLSEDERQMQMAMAASMGVDASQSEGESRPAEVQNYNPGAASAQAEEEAFAKAMAESLGQPAEASSIEQIQTQNNLYQEQLAQGFEDEDAALARALAESENNQ